MKNYYLIKSINCIVSDTEIKEGDKILVLNKWIQTCLKVHDFNGLQIEWNPEIDFGTIAKEQCKKIEYSNNKIEGLKPFELVDEVEELAKQIYLSSECLKEIQELEGEGKLRAGYTQEFMLEKMFPKWCEIFTIGYKAKAGYTESQMIGFAEWCEKQYDWNGAGWVWKSSNAEVVRDSKYILNAYLQSQDSKLIEVIQISDSVFKIKK